MNIPVTIFITDVSPGWGNSHRRKYELVCSFYVRSGRLTSRGGVIVATIKIGWFGLFRKKQITRKKKGMLESLRAEITRQAYEWGYDKADEIARNLRRGGINGYSY